MPRLPQVSKFRGDFTQSYEQWILEFEAQMKAIGCDNAKHKDILICCCEDAAFSTLVNTLSADNTIDYAGLKAALKAKFCGEDYKRTLQTKLRNIKFEPGMKVATFITELCRIIKELYALTDQEAIKSIAVSHVLSTLDSNLRDEVRILQLSGNLRLENLLEFIDSKFQKNSFNHFSSHVPSFVPSTNQFQSHCSSAYVSANQNSDMNEIKEMFKQLLKTQVCQQLSINNSQDHNTQGNKNTICDHCHKTGHVSSNCFQLKTCFKCKKKGHISKYCKEQNNSHVNTSAGQVLKANKNIAYAHENVKLESVQRIKVTAVISGQKVEFLYDPGSEYTILPRRLYETLINKPPLVPISHCGVGVNNSKFLFDGLAYLNIDFYRPDGSYYTVPYESVLVSSEITQPIFGIHTEYKFRLVERNHETKELILHPKDTTKAITLTYLLEQKSGVNSAFIQVAKTNIIKDNELSFIERKVKGTKDFDNGKLFNFEGCYSDKDIDIADVKLDSIENNSMSVPMLNRSGSDVRLKKGEIVGYLNSVEAVEENGCNMSEELFVSTFDLKGEALMLDEKQGKFKSIFNKYRTCIYNTPVTEPCRIPIEHRIDLIDDKPISLPARRIPYNINNEVKEEVQKLIEKNVIGHSSSAYSAPLVPVVKKDGSIRLCIDILYNASSKPSGITSLDQFKVKLQNMYDMAREKMNMRQEKFASYYDQKVLNDELVDGDKVYVYLPRNKRLKLVPNWYGPFLVTSSNHPVYQVEIVTPQGIISKTLTRDRLKRVKENIPLMKLSRNVNKEVVEPLGEDVVESSDDDSDFEDNTDEPYRNRLRSRPCMGPQRFIEMQSCYVPLL